MDGEKREHRVGIVKLMTVIGNLEKNAATFLKCTRERGDVGEKHTHLNPKARFIGVQVEPGFSMALDDGIMIEM